MLTPVQNSPKCYIAHTSLHQWENICNLHSWRQSHFPISFSATQFTSGLEQLCAKPSVQAINFLTKQNKFILPTIKPMSQYVWNRHSDPLLLSTVTFTPVKYNFIFFFHHICSVNIVVAPLMYPQVLKYLFEAAHRPLCQCRSDYARENGQQQFLLTFNDNYVVVLHWCFLSTFMCLLFHHKLPCLYELP